MAKIRHIAYRVKDLEAMAEFFIKGFEMKIVERRTSGAIDLSDGTLNITLLPATTNHAGGESPLGIGHIGFTVADESEARRLVEAAGGREANTIRMDTAHYEIKFEGPEGIIVDVGHWAGTAPIDEEEAVVAPLG